MATRIEWVKNPDNITQGYTWNPITGCLNGCEYCYARKLANTRLKERYLANWNLGMEYSDYYALSEADRIKALSDPFFPRFWPEKLKQLYRPKLSKAKPRGIFVCDISDLLGIGVPEEWTRQVMEAIRNDPIDRFYLLTKQPQNLAKWSPFPPNCWVGATATDPHTLIKGLWHMNKVEAKVKYLSLEPLLDWAAVLPPDISYLEKNLRDVGISWLIIGAQTKPFVAPEIAWVREIVQAADKAGIKVFLKNSLYPILNDTLPEIDFDHKPLLFWRHDGFQYQLRQEMPECKPA